MARYAKTQAAVYQQAIQANVYDWPRVTRRSNGRIVTAPRNIVDTGRLKNSQTFNQLSAFVIQYTWAADYAASVYYGGTTTAGLEAPARNWITHANKNIRNPLDMLVAELRKNFP